MEGGDEVMVFFAGHGVQLGSTNYLLPTDITGESEDQIKDDAIHLQREPVSGYRPAGAR